MRGAWSRLALLLALAAVGGVCAWLFTQRGEEVRPVKVECRAGLLIPLYAYPMPAGELVKLREEYPGLPIIVMVNPSNGPGSKLDAARYAGAIRELRAANITVVGYVYTSYTRRSVEDVERDVEKYASWYELDGIFLDEVTCDENASHLEYYRRLAERIRSMGLKLVIGNPGTWAAEEYFDFFDIVVIWENPQYPPLEELQRYKSLREKAAVLVYNQEELDEEKLSRLIENVKWIYVTDDGGENPWDTLSTHLRDTARIIAEATAHQQP